MTKLINVYGAIITLDPTSAYSDRDDEYIQEWIGLIPYILCGGLRDEGELAETFKKRGENGYAMTAGSTCSWDNTATISDDGTYNYPDDEPLKPLAKFEMGGETAFCYEYGFVSVMDNGNWIHCRMD